MTSDLITQAYDNLEAADHEVRGLVEDTPRFRDHPELRAAAYATLAEARAMAYTFAIAPRLDQPRFQSQQSWHYNVFSVGPSNGDFRYAIALLDGAASYRLRGRLGGAHLVLLQVYNHILGHPESKILCDHQLQDLADADGNLDIPVGAGATIELDPSSRLNLAVVRRIFSDVTVDPGELYLVKEGRSAVDADPSLTAERLDRAADFLRYLVREWIVGLYDLYIEKSGGRNQVFYVPGSQIASDLLGSPVSTYGFSIFDVGPDEGVIVDWQPPPSSAYWSFQLGDVWARALDYPNYQIDLNNKFAALDDDGRFRAVISAVDPGVPNWLDNRGHREGHLTMRNYLASEDTGPPTLTRLPLTEVRDRLPATTPSISGAERQAVLERRRSMFRAAFGD